MTRTALTLALVLPLAACGSDDAPPPPPSASAPAETAPAGPEEITGQLIGGDDTLQSGELYDVHEVVMREGQWLRAELISPDFDPYVIVRSPTGTQTDVDDSQEGNLSLSKAIVRATESGAWQIAVTTFEPGESGNYTLSYEVLDERPADAHEGRQIDAPAESDDVSA